LWAFGQGGFDFKTRRRALLKRPSPSTFYRAFAFAGTVSMKALSACRTWQHYQSPLLSWLGSTIKACRTWQHYRSLSYLAALSKPDLLIDKLPHVLRGLNFHSQFPFASVCPDQSSKFVCILARLQVRVVVMGSIIQITL
jgi:hypothetical protein